MKRSITTAALLAMIATPAFAEVPTTGPTEAPMPRQTSAAYVRRSVPALSATSKPEKIAAPSPLLQSLYPLSIQQQQEEDQRLLDRIFNIEHSG